DHGNLHGAWSFYAEAKARKIRPILGFEAYLAFGSRHAREKPAADAPLGAPYSHLVLLAKNRIGYQNLIRLSSIGFLECCYLRARRDAPPRTGHRTSRGGHQRRALPEEGRRRGARRAARDRHRQRPRRSEALSLFRTGELRQVREGDVDAVQPRRRTRGDGARRRAVRIRFREAVFPAPVSAPRGVRV